MATDLFKSLQSHPILLPQGLRITQQMADAVENCWDRRIYHVDLRITNILVTTLLFGLCFFFLLVFLLKDSLTATGMQS